MARPRRGTHPRDGRLPGRGPDRQWGPAPRHPVRDPVPPTAAPAPGRGHPHPGAGPAPGDPGGGRGCRAAGAADPWARRQQGLLPAHGLRPRRSRRGARHRPAGLRALRQAAADRSALHDGLVRRHGQRLPHRPGAGRRPHGRQLHGRTYRAGGGAAPPALGPLLRGARTGPGLRPDPPPHPAAAPRTGPVERSGTAPPPAPGRRTLRPRPLRRRRRPAARAPPCRGGRRAAGVGGPPPPARGAGRGPPTRRGTRPRPGRLLASPAVADRPEPVGVRRTGPSGGQPLCRPGRSCGARRHGGDLAWRGPRPAVRGGEPHCSHADRVARGTP